MFAEDIKNKLSDLAIKGMTDSDSYNMNPGIIKKERTLSLKRKSLNKRSIQLKLFEI